MQLKLVKHKTAFEIYLFNTTNDIQFGEDYEVVDLEIESDEFIKIFGNPLFYIDKGRIVKEEQEVEETLC
jgi:hypothetical protein